MGEQQVSRVRRCQGNPACQHCQRLPWIVGAGKQCDPLKGVGMLVEREGSSTWAQEQREDESKPHMSSCWLASLVPYRLQQRRLQSLFKGMGLRRAISKQGAPRLPQGVDGDPRMGIIITHLFLQTPDSGGACSASLPHAGNATAMLCPQQLSEARNSQQS